MKILLLLITFFLSSISSLSKKNDNLNDLQLRAKADSLAHKFIIIDTHIDAPDLLHDNMTDISIQTTKGEFDFPRAIKGGLNVPFMSIYTSAGAAERDESKKIAEELINIVYDLTKKFPDKFVIASSVKDVTSQFGSGKISLAMGMENGSPIEGKLDNLKYFYGRGIRYITLCHYGDNLICDSANDPEKKWNGLSPFGEKVVAEMNRLGMMVDVSHISDSSFYDVIRVSKAPVIASHSSCRYFTPGFPRNMDDEMIKALSKNGGVININFGSTFINNTILENQRTGRKKIAKYIKANNLESGSKEARDFRRNYWKENPRGYADVSDVAKNIDHVVQLVGIDYVGIGSDFDGLGDELPTGLKDVSQYPNLIYELLKMGYSDEDIQKICGGNLLRVWKQVEDIAKNLQANIH